jgi:hypothetical protein
VPPLTLPANRVPTFAPEKSQFGRPRRSPLAGQSRAITSAARAFFIASFWSADQASPFTLIVNALLPFFTSRVVPRPLPVA